MKQNKNLIKLLNLHYLKYANKTVSCGEFDMPALYCNIDTYPDYIALYSNVKDYHKTERTAISFYQFDDVFDGKDGLFSEAYPIRPGDDSANLLHDSKVQGFSEIKDMINMGFCEFRDFNYYRIDSLSKEEVGQIYENRGNSLEKWLNSEDADGLFDENEKAFLIEQYSEMKAPLYYEDYDGWRSALSYAQTIIMLIMLVSAFLVSGIFSNEFSWKSDSIFFSTKYGRDKGTRTKIIAGFIVVSAIYFIVISLYSLVVLGCLGSQGGNVMIQTGFWHWKSFYNITYPILKPFRNLSFIHKMTQKILIFKATEQPVTSNEL